jgi:PAS domain S-box-containing protein
LAARAARFLTDAPLPYKLLLLPAIALGALGISIVVTAALGLRSTSLQGEIQRGYFPLYTLSRDLEGTVAEMQQRLRSAVAARDTEQLARVDSLQAIVRSRAARARGNPAANAAALAQLSQALDAYMALAPHTARRMIEGETGLDLADSIAAMTARYARIKRLLDAEIARDDREVAIAFASARRAQRATTDASIAIGVVCVLIIAALSAVIIRSLARRIQGAVVVANTIARGEIEIDVPEATGDEIGQLHAAMGEMVANLAVNIEEIRASEEHSRELAEHLEVASERLQHLVRSSPAVLYGRRLSGDHAFTFIGDNLSALLGGTADDWMSRVHPDDRVILAAALKRLVTEPQVTVEYRVDDGTGGGAYRWVLDQMRCVIGGRTPEIVGWWVDVTTRRAAEEAQRRLAATLEATSDVVGIATTAGALVYLNRAARRIVGLDDDRDIAGMALADLFAPGARELLHGIAVPAALRTGAWEGESALAAASGDALPVSQVIVAHGNGDAGYLSTIMRDISAWKRLDRVKSEFVSTVSHELRTPLTAMRGSLGLLEAGKVGTIGPAPLKLIRLARENADRLIRLINDMLDLDKIEAERLTVCLQPVAPVELVDATIEGIRGFAEERGIRMEKRTPATPLVCGDRDRLIQVLTNLVSNAIKFAEPRATVRIEVTDHCESAVRFAVSNEGPGIAPADVPRLFRRFQQLDSADNRRHGGTGLGLAISKAIVEQHEGRIGVESEPHGWTTFWFEIPVSIL